MKLRRTCREVTHLVLEGEDRTLTIGERVVLRLHLMACRACPRFVRQVRFMREAMRAWRTDGGD
jgi:hypothetical protein